MDFLLFEFNFSSYLIPSACLIVFLLAYFTFKQYLYRQKYSHIPGPPTEGILEFFFGNFNTIVKCLTEKNIIPDLYVQWSKKYGSVFKFQIFMKYVIVTNEPNAIKEILINKNYPKNEKIYSKIGFPFNERFMGLGLVTETNGGQWRKRRQIFNPGFHRSVLINCLSQFNEKTDQLMEKLYKLADGKTEISLFKEINRMTLDIISSVAFGFCIDSINFPDNQFSLNIIGSFEAVNRCLTDPLFMMNPLNYWKKQKYKKYIRDLRNFARVEILDRLRDLHQNETSVPDDILTAIVNKCKDDKIEIESFIDDFITFFNAGQETTANSIAFCFLELGKNTHILPRLREEIDSVLGAKKEISLDDLTKLEYTECVFKETLRLWPPAPEILRVSTDDFYINDFKIPKNTQINLSPYFSGRNEKYFPNPDKFIPERFLNEISSYAYFPFSLGPRNCIGRNFAMIESKIFMS
uniref:Cytochrome p450 3049C1 n=1 Tax=Brachionus koreanus TaxID=1199090 RepID=W8RKV4_9BILA|nr:cytochrome p450 3049C1 [Brachionus koreanus]